MDMIAKAQTVKENHPQKRQTAPSEETETKETAETETRQFPQTAHNWPRTREFPVRQ